MLTQIIKYPGARKPGLGHNLLGFIYFSAVVATAMKHARYGDVHPHTVPPFVVGHAGGIKKEGMQFFRTGRDAADSKLNTRESDLSSWSSCSKLKLKGLSNFFLQSLPLATPKGLGSLFTVTAASIRAD